MRLFKRTWKCRYCGRKYKSWGVWSFRHFNKKHPDDKISVVEV